MWDGVEYSGLCVGELTPTFRSAMLNVRCNTSAVLDAKGRLALPARVRDLVEERGASCLTIHPWRGCLWAWFPDDYERTVAGPLSKVSAYSPEVRRFVQLVSLQAKDVSIDSQRRILLDADLKTKVGIKRDVFVAAAPTHLEIYDLETWKAHIAALEADADVYEQLPDVLSGGWG